jgi:hypothetical protein
MDMDDAWYNAWAEPTPPSAYDEQGFFHSTPSSAPDTDEDPLFGLTQSSEHSADESSDEGTVRPVPHAEDQTMYAEDQAMHAENQAMHAENQVKHTENQTTISRLTEPPADHNEEQGSGPIDRTNRRRTQLPAETMHGRMQEKATEAIKARNWRLSKRLKVGCAVKMPKR